MKRKKILKGGVVGEWGLNKSPADINNDGTVNVSDLLELIGAWGPCM